MEARAENSSSELFVEELPPEVAARVGGRLSAGEVVRMQVASDMADEQRYGEQWLVVTEQRVLAVPSDGREGAGVDELALAQVGEVRTQELVGGGRLEVEGKEGTGQISICYSSTLVAKFAEVAGGIRQLSKGETLTLPTQMELSRCEGCGRLLPEKDGICPFCISKWDTIRRIAAFLAPYRKRVMVFVAVSMAMTGMELVPPLLVKYIIDDVLKTYFRA